MESIGKNIAQMRREKQLTQDSLAKAIGISPQAVSKWENGGVPDIELLPKLADFFEVSIDALFGRERNKKDIQNLLAEKFCDTTSEKKFDLCFDLCWAMERCFMDTNLEHGGTIEEIRNDLAPNNRRYSSIQTDNGFTLMGLDGVLPYYLLVPDSPDKEKGYFENIDYPKLFKDLSDKDFFDSLVLLNRRNFEIGFNEDLLVSSLNICESKVASIIQTMRKYHLLNVITAECGGKLTKVYTYRPNPAIAAMLIFAREIIQRPNSYTYFMAARSAPYL